MTSLDQRAEEEVIGAALAEELEGVIPTPVAPRRVSDPQYQGLATEKGYNQEYGRIKRTGYSHEAMIDVIIANPGIHQDELAVKFGYSVPWISRVIGSDAFQAALSKRREELTDPFLVATIEERLKGLASQSIDVIAKKLQDTQSADIALKALDLTTKAMGFGMRDRSAPSGPVTNNFVVALPGKSESSDAWSDKYTGTTIEAQPLSSTISRDPTLQPRVTELAGREAL